jgi:pyroglutamyl-peptidase
MAEIKRILLTGFEPYANFDINASGEVAKLLDGKKLGSCMVHSIVLPVSFKDSFKALKQRLIRAKPWHAIISMGLSPYASAVRVERIAINIMDCNGIPDNKGEKPVDEPIVPNGELAYLSTLPVRKIIRNLNRAQVPATLSNSAGTHLCNCIMYSVLNFVSQNDWKTKAGFIHLPFLPQQLPKIRNRPPNTPSLPLETSVKAIRIALETVATSVSSATLKQA